MDLGVGNGLGNRLVAPTYPGQSTSLVLKEVAYDGTICMA